MAVYGQAGRRKSLRVVFDGCRGRHDCKGAAARAWSVRAAARAAGEGDYLGGGSEGSSLAESLTSRSVIAAATGFEPVPGFELRGPMPARAADISGGGNEGSSLAESRTSWSVIAAPD